MYLCGHVCASIALAHLKYIRYDMVIGPIKDLNTQLLDLCDILKLVLLYIYCSLTYENNIQLDK